MTYNNLPHSSNIHNEKGLLTKQLSVESIELLSRELSQNYSVIPLSMHPAPECIRRTRTGLNDKKLQKIFQILDYPVLL